MNLSEQPISIVGGGLAGSEAAFQLAEKGYRVHLYEMRPEKSTPAHKTGQLAELVCSNSFGSIANHAAPGQLKWEAERLGSKVLEWAWKAYVPAGQALGIDRELFARPATGPGCLLQLVPRSSFFRLLALRRGTGRRGSRVPGVAVHRAGSRNRASPLSSNFPEPGFPIRNNH